MWSLSTEIQPNYDGGLMRAKHLKGGFRTVNTKSQRNAIPYLSRFLDVTESTICFVESESKLYRLISNPLGATIDSDWELVVLGGITSFTPVGTWDSNNTTPVLSDAGAIGRNGEFYFVVNTVSPFNVTVPGLFLGVTTTVVNGNMVVSIGSQWIVVKNNTTWASLDKPAVITNYVNGIVQAHTHLTTDITDLNTYMNAFLRHTDVTDDTAAFGTIPDAKIPDVGFLRAWYYTKVDIDELLSHFTGGGGGTLTNGSGTTAAGSHVNWGGTLIGGANIVGAHPINFGATGTNITGLDVTVSSDNTSAARFQVFGNSQDDGSSYILSKADKDVVLVGMDSLSFVRGYNVYTGTAITGSVLRQQMDEVGTTIFGSVAVPLPEFHVHALSTVHDLWNPTATTTGLAITSSYQGHELQMIDVVSLNTVVYSSITSTASSTSHGKTGKYQLIVNSADSALSGSLTMGLTAGGTDNFATSLNTGGNTISLLNVAGFNGIKIENSSFFSLQFQSSGLLVYDVRAGVAAKGLEYAGDYSANYSSRSLVDKAYVLSVASSGGWTLNGTSTFAGAVVIDQTITPGRTLQFLTQQLNTTPTDGKGIWIVNDTTALNSAQQVSGSVVWEGRGFATGVSNSQSVKFRAYTLPVQAATNPTGVWRLDYSVNANAYATALQVSTSGQVSLESINKIDSSTALQIRSNFSAATMATGMVHLFNNSNMVPTSGAHTEVGIGGVFGFVPPSGSATYNALRVQSVINQTAAGGATGQITIVNANPTITDALNVTGFDWNPVTPGNIRGTQLAWRNTSGNILIGGTSITAGSVIVDIQSTTRALIVSRVTNIGSVATPVDAMIAYDAATNLFNFRQGGAWVTFSAGSGAPFSDASALVKNSADATKLMIFSAASITTGTTRTFTLPDVNDTLLTLTATQTLTNKTLGNTNTVTLKDTLFTLQDDGDITKQVRFQLSGVATGTLRVWTFPDVDGTFARKDAAQTFIGTQTFSPTTTISGVNIGSFAGDPSGLNNADLWYNSTSNTLKARINGVSVILGGTATPFADNTALVKNSADNTKLLILSAASITTGTTRTWTFPDINGTVATITAAQTFAGVQTFSSIPIFSAGIGSATATTQAVGDNSTKVATTAYVDAITLGAFSTVAPGYVDLSGGAGKLLLGDNSWLAIGASGKFLTTNGTVPSWSASTITLGGNFTTSGAFTTTLTVTANTNVTLPTSGTLITIGAAVNNELMKSNGTTVVASGIFSASVGSITLGAAGTASAERVVTTNGAGASESLALLSRGSGSSVRVGNSNNSFGFSVDGNGNASMTLNVTATNHSISGGNPGSVLGFYGNNSGTTGVTGVSLVFLSGAAVAGNANSGNIYLDVGAKAGSGTVGNIGFFTQVGTFGTGEKVVFISDATTNPSTNPTAGGIMFVKSADHKPYWRTPAGVETVMLSTGGGGITNSAIANEMMKSDGTNAVPSGVFSTVAGDLTFGTGLSGAARTLTAGGTAPDIDFSIVAKGAANLLVAALGITILASTSRLTLSPTGLTQIPISGTLTNFGLTAAAGISGSVVGADITLAAGAAYNTGNNNGGNAYLRGGVKNGSGLDGNVGLNTNAGSFGGGGAVVFMADATTNPTTNPTGGGIMFVKPTDHKPYWRDTIGVEDEMTTNTAAMNIFLYQNFI